MSGRKQMFAKLRRLDEEITRLLLSVRFWDGDPTMVADQLATVVALRGQRDELRLQLGLK